MENRTSNVREIDEKDLLGKLIEGEEGAFARFYDLYNREIFQFIVRYVSSEPMAEDLTQEVFMKIWESRGRLREVQSFKAYLFIVARNHTLNSLKAIFRSEVAMAGVIKGFIELRNSTEEDLLTREYLDFIGKVLNGLPERTREIFRLCREQGKSYEEVATALNISRNAVKNHMVYSMKVLRAAAKKDLGVSLALLFALLKL